MKLVSYSVFDTKARAYFPPFFLHNDDLAVRVFSDCANDRTHQFGRHPQDYVLFRVGTFDDATGVFVSETPNSLGLAIEFVVNTPVSSGALIQGGCDE